MLGFPLRKHLSWVTSVAALVFSDSAFLVTGPVDSLCALDYGSGNCPCCLGNEVVSDLCQFAKASSLHRPRLPLAHWRASDLLIMV